MPDRIDRRTFLARGGGAAGAVLLAGGLPGLLAACGSSSKSSTASPSTSGAGSSTTAKKDFGKVSFKLAWFKDVEFAGSYIADQKGYYKAEGIDIDLVSGGPTASPVETDLVTGKVLSGLSAPDFTIKANQTQNAGLIIIGTMYQKSPFAIVSLQSNPIPDAQAMKGKRIGVQQGANTTIFQSFLKANNLTLNDVKIVPAQFDPTPLTQGQADGWFSFITNEPIILRDKGFPVTTFLLNDQKYPLVGNTYTFRKKDLTENRDKVKAFMRAEIKGWRDSVADPTLGAQYAVDIYGKSENLPIKGQTEQSQEQNKLVQNDDTKRNGLFTMSDALIDESLKTLALSGVNVKREDIFDTSVLQEIYKEDPSLKG